MEKSIRHIELGGGYSMRRKIILDISTYYQMYEVMAMLSDGEELDSNQFSNVEDAYAEFDRYFNKYAEDCQKSVYNAKLEYMEKYTIAMCSDFGFPVAYQIYYLGADYAPYAQHSDVVRIKYRRKNKRHDEIHHLHNKSISIFKGWQYLPENFGYDVIDNSGVCTTRMSKYGCFDNRYIEDMNHYFKNPVLIYDGSKIGVDGKRYA